MAKNTGRNALDSSRAARKRYDEKNYKYQTTLFKITELEEINEFCKNNNIQKNTLLRAAVMQFVKQPFDRNKWDLIVADINNQ